jgi:hypothetical protein
VVGTITANTTAATGKYSWEVGKYIGGTAIPGDGYRIVIKSYTPEMKDSSHGPFTIAKEVLISSPAAKEVFKSSSSGMATKTLSLTYPRRGDRWHKGSGYTIKWNSTGLQDAKLKLQLLAIDGQTVVMTIGENIDNNGQTFWAVPMSLPDAETFYKMRIQTMDNALSDTVGPFPIAKGTAAPGPPAIKVTAPGGPGHRIGGAAGSRQGARPRAVAAGRDLHDGQRPDLGRGNPAGIARRGGNQVDVLNRCRLERVDGKEKSAQGVARVVDPAVPPKLEVSFFRPFWGEYWIIDLGPEGGDGGGRVVCEGTPEQVARDKRSHTGRFLRSLLAGK